MNRALVIGGGIAGMSAAIGLREAGLAVDLVDRDPEWRVYGAGITITGPTLRAMKQLGILAPVMERGYTADGLLVCSASGETLSKIDTDGPGTIGVPGAGGIMRPVLHQIMSERLLSLEPSVSLGVTVESLEIYGTVRAVFSDGRRAEYDLVVGADGIYSKTRKQIFPDAPKPEYTGQVCWRLMMARHPDIDRRTYFLGGPSKVGLNPVAPEQMYMFLLERQGKIQRYDDETLYLRLRDLLELYGGVLEEVRSQLTASSNIVYRPLEAIFLEKPWYRGAAILIGDAAHATTPQLASGAGMALEDGIALGESVAGATSVADAFSRFMERRYDRCQLVVSRSLKIGELEVAGAPAEAQARVVQETLETLNEPF